MRTKKILKSKKIAFIAVFLVFISLFPLSSCSQELREVKIAYACQTELNDRSPDSAISYVTKKVINTSGERLYLLTMQLALQDPETEGLISPFPNGVIVHSIRLDDKGMAKVVFSDGYAALDGMSRTLAESCTLYTLIQFPEITSVSICTESDQESSAVLTDEKRITDIADFRLNEYDLKFYFPNEDKSALTPINKQIVISDLDSLPETVMYHLILGYRFERGYRRHISQHTECLSAKVKSRTCYVDLNEYFLEHNDLTEDGVSLTVYSVVNTLCQLDDIDKVQILINGNIFDYAMNVDMSKPLDPNYSLVEQ